MKRNEFLQSVIRGTGNAGPATPYVQQLNTASKGPLFARSLTRTMAGLEQYAGTWDVNTAAHLLRRTMFGPRRAEVLAVSAGNMSTAVDTLLADQQEPAPPTGIVGTTTYDFTNAAYDSNNDGTFRNYLKAWWLGLMVKQGISITEKMTLFWHNHFVSEAGDIQDSRYSYYQNKLFRQNALKNFKDLVKAVSIDPAMLRYLNGNQNVKARPNENYGRELQELFTIGKGPEIAQGNYTNYTEQDVQAAAKVLTGWTDRVPNSTLPASLFVSAQHDGTNKVFSSAYQSSAFPDATIRPTLNSDGTFNGSKEIDDFLTMIFSTRDTNDPGGPTRVAKFICRKLYRWFVYYDIDSVTEQNVIRGLAQTLVDNNYEIKPVLSQLLKSSHFYDANNMGCFIRTPIDIVVGPVRQTNSAAALPDLSLATNYGLSNSLRNTAATLGMNLFDPPDVAGWKAFYQIPDFYELWINATTLPTRGQYTDALLASTGIRSGGGTLKIDPVAYAQTMSAADNPYTLLDDLARELCALTLTQKQKDYLMYNVMLLHQGSEYEWTTNWQAYMANPNNTTAKNFVTNTLTNLLKFMLRMAEAHLA